MESIKCACNGGKCDGDCRDKHLEKMDANNIPVLCSAAFSLPRDMRQQYGRYQPIQHKKRR